MRLRFIDTASCLASVLLFGILFAGCVAAKFHPLPPPPPEAKLRVLVYCISGPAPKGGWTLSHAQFKEQEMAQAAKFLDRTGVYAVVPEGDVKKVLGSAMIDFWEWERRGWTLSREAGKAVHAEYVMLFERGWRTGKYLRIALVNVGTGAHFKVWGSAKQGVKGDFWDVMKACYGEIARQARGDLLATAARKGYGLGTSGEDASFPEATATPAETSGKPSVALGTEVAVEEPEKGEGVGPGKVRLAVHDLEADDPMKIAALVLSDALREELFRTGRFVLVNRENFNQVIQEMLLGHTGLVQERQVIEAGKALAARQILVGRFATFGDSALLQAKIVDTETHETLAISSLQCPQGRENELIRGLPGLVTRLTDSH